MTRAQRLSASVRNAIKCELIALVAVEVLTTENHAVLLIFALRLLLFRAQVQTARNNNRAHRRSMHRKRRRVRWQAVQTIARVNLPALPAVLGLRGSIRHLASCASCADGPPPNSDSFAKYAGGGLWTSRSPASDGGSQRTPMRRPRLAWVSASDRRSDRISLPLISSSLMVSVRRQQKQFWRGFGFALAKQQDGISPDVGTTGISTARERSAPRQAPRAVNPGSGAAGVRIFNGSPRSG